MESIVVTGGNGFLGSHIASRLRSLGYTVRIFARRHGQEPQREGFETVWGDVRDKEAVRRAVQGMDRVIHTISNFRKGGSDKDEAYAINVVGTRHVLEACSEFQVKQLVHCSTIGVHGNVKEIPATENTPYNPGDLYQETKLEAERAVRQYAQEHALPTTVIRPISLMGPEDVRMLKLFRMIQKGKFIKIGPCSAYFQPAYIDDVVTGFITCLGNEKAVGQVFIIGGEEYVSLEELFHIIAEELGVAPPRMRIPLAPVLFLAALCEAVCVPLHIAPPLHRRRVSFFQNNRAFDITRAKEQLGYRPAVPLRAAIQKTIAWYKQEGWL